MGLAAVYLGNQSWTDYISDRDCLSAFGKAIEQEAARLEGSLAVRGAMRVALCQSDYEIAVESGLGALGVGAGADDSPCSIEFGYERLAGGLDQLNADFNFLLGDVIWKLEMHEETLSNLLHELRLAGFEREARAYRSRAEKAYFNGWDEEGPTDFLGREKRKYSDFGRVRWI